ncbi:hypothetical protein Slala03_53600 [Streptomyces lavendulae subsp. lavendulae]|nr:hypothetical protein Slala03_53600 [Streptomyces lavendulae subsp. lavendulae]
MPEEGPAQQRAGRFSAEGSAAIVVHEDRVLWVRRRVAEGNLSWQFPAGKAERVGTSGYRKADVVRRLRCCGWFRTGRRPAEIADVASRTGSSSRCGGTWRP